MHYLYVIHSKSIDRYYVGESPNIINRLDQHNSHYFKKGFTKAAKDWVIVMSMKCNNREDGCIPRKIYKANEKQEVHQKNY